LAQARNLFLRQRRVRGCGEDAQNRAASRARSEMPFPLAGFFRGQRFLRVCGDDLGIGTFVHRVRRHPVQSFAHTPGELFFALPDFSFVSCVHYGSSFI
jgi:hypothetical protein